MSRELIDRRVRLASWMTAGWISIELGAGLAIGIRARSVVLTAFAADSGIELVSALLVLLRFRRGTHWETRSAKLAAWLLYLLAIYICVASAISLLVPGRRPEPTIAGTALLAATSVVMPALSAWKKRLARETGSATVAADAAQSSLCAYLSWIALAALCLNVFVHVDWADSLGALALLPIVLREAANARQGSAGSCC